MGEMMKRISLKARLSKTYTKHCVRASCTTRLSSSGVPDSIIMSTSGHKSVCNLQQNDREAGSHHCSCSGSWRREAEVHHCRCANGRWWSRRRGRGSGLGTARAAGWAGEAQRELSRRSPCLCNPWPCTCHELCRCFVLRMYFFCSKSGLRCSEIRLLRSIFFFQI